MLGASIPSCKTDHTVAKTTNTGALDIVTKFIVVLWLFD